MCWPVDGFILALWKCVCGEDGHNVLDQETKYLSGLFFLALRENKRFQFYPTRGGKKKIKVCFALVNRENARLPPCQGRD